MTRFDDAETLEELIFQGIGAGSTCWDNLRGAGVFDSVQAKEIGDEVLERVRGLMDASGAGLVISEDKSVINFLGENYYKACGVLVTSNADGAASYCVLREGHPYYQHEDYDGNTRDATFAPLMFDAAVVEMFRRALKSSGLDSTQIFNALNAIHASHLKMTLADRVD